MKMWGKVDAVKIYPSGGLIYQAANHGNTMNVPVAVREFVNDRPALIAIENIAAFQVALAAVQEVKSHARREVVQSTTQTKEGQCTIQQ